MKDSILKKYVNKDMLNNANLNPAGPKTRDELKEYARKLSKNGEEYGFSTTYLLFVFNNNFVITDFCDSLSGDNFISKFDTGDIICAC